MNDAERREAYYDRVRPIVGEFFENKGFAAFGVEAFPHAVEALVRTGARRAWLEDHPVQEGTITRAWGQTALGQSASEALLGFSRAHNRFEENFDIKPAPSLREEIPALARDLSGADLLLAWAPSRARKILALARAKGVPAILVSVLEKSRAAQAIFVFDPSQDAPEADAIAEFLETSPAADPDDPDRREDFLEAGDLALAFAKALLLRDTPRARADLARLWGEGRTLVVRGSPSWAWETRFLTLEEAKSLLPRLAEGAHPLIRLPRKLFLRHRVLVLGCGTASLFVDEIARDVSALLLLDSKPFSIYNPIRQLCSTDDTESLEKPFALQDILKRRIDPEGDWREEKEGPITWRHGPSLSVAAASLHLSEMMPESLALFEDLIERFSPTIAIVGMGKSRDDNFTACEILRKRNIPHIVPTAFPGVTHFKHIVVEGEGPCYDCLQNHLPVDGGAGPTLHEEARSVYYGGTQPATLAETYPSAHSLYRLARALMLPMAARPRWWAPLREEERVCLVGANQVERTGEGWLYGCSLPGQMVAYGPGDVVHARSGERCVCGRVVGK